MLMENLVSLLSLEYFPFICIRNLFYKLNVCKVKAIKKELTDSIACRVTIADPTSFQHMETIKYLLFHSPFIKVRK